MSLSIPLLLSGDLHTTHFNGAVSRLIGRVQLGFSRQPFSHWSLTFTSTPQMEVDVTSRVAGRSFSHVTQLVASQVSQPIHFIAFILFHFIFIFFVCYIFIRIISSLFFIIFCFHCSVVFFFVVFCSPASQLSPPPPLSLSPPPQRHDPSQTDTLEKLFHCRFRSRSGFRRSTRCRRNASASNLSFLRRTACSNPFRPRHAAYKAERWK